DFVAEKYHAQIAAIFDRWIAALLKSPAATSEVEATLAPTLSAISPIPKDSQKVRSSSFLTVFRNNFSPEKAIDRAAWIRDWRFVLNRFSSLQTVEFQVTEIRLNSDSNRAPTSIQTRVRFEFVGSGNGFHREHRVGTWDITWSLGPTDEPK